MQALQILGGVGTLEQVRVEVERIFGDDLSKEAKEAEENTRPGQSLWKKHLRSAKQALVDDGKLFKTKDVGHNVWQISPSGQANDVPGEKVTATGAETPQTVAVEPNRCSEFDEEGDDLDEDSYGPRYRQTIEIIEDDYETIFVSQGELLHDALEAIGERWFEGTRIKVLVERIERNAAARERCIAHHGAICAACKFSFLERYGEFGSGFIHVHHLHPLKDTKGHAPVDPIDDLVPLCPNCHAMVHRTSPPLTVADLQALIARSIP